MTTSIIDELVEDLEKSTLLKPISAMIIGLSPDQWDDYAAAVLSYFGEEEYLTVRKTLLFHLDMFKALREANKVSPGEQDGVGYAIGLIAAHWAMLTELMAEKLNVPTYDEYKEIWDAGK